MKEDVPIDRAPLAEKTIEESSTDGETAEPMSQTSKNMKSGETSDREKDLFILWTQRFYDPNREQCDSQLEWDVRLTIWDKHDRDNGIAWHLGTAKHPPLGEARKIAKYQGLLHYEPSKEPSNEPLKLEAWVPHVDLPMPDYVEGAPDPGRELLLKNLVLRYNEWEDGRVESEAKMRRDVQQQLEDIGSRRRFLDLQTKILETDTEALAKKFEADYGSKAKENERIAAELQAEMKTIAARFDLNLDIRPHQIILPLIPLPQRQMDSDSFGESPLRGRASKRIEMSSANETSIARVLRQTMRPMAREVDNGDASALNSSTGDTSKPVEFHKRRYSSDDENLQSDLERQNEASNLGKHEGMQQDFGQQRQLTHQSRRVNHHQANMRFTRGSRHYKPGGRTYQDMNHRGRSRSPKDRRRSGRSDRNMEMDQRRLSRFSGAESKMSSNNVAQEFGLRDRSKRGEPEKEVRDEGRVRGYAGYTKSPRK